jgi:hypothetical protein
MIRRLESAVAVIGVVAMLMIGTVRPAQAYTDPGTGALIWQTMAAAFVAVLFYFRKVMFWFKNRKGPRD